MKKNGFRFLATIRSPIAIDTHWNGPDILACGTNCPRRSDLEVCDQVSTLCVRYSRRDRLGARAHLGRILRAYARYYNAIRTRRSLNKDAPVSRPVQRTGIIRSDPILNDFITTTFGLRFSLHTGIDRNAFPPKINQTSDKQFPIAAYRYIMRCYV
jgi:hypothetical protein